MSASRLRPSFILQWRHARPRPCSTTFMPICSRPMPGNAANLRERTMAEATFVEAINLALARALEDDPDVVVRGEDVGVNGGLFRATAGLQKRFGSERVLDTPLAELLISG